ncbi:hypothetical protein Daus18300_000866 [Diaporthe australafricana]|uniref:Uncharacterized protein n=1 Tax=Diaporthe australafricana TaxID=127596 RepID=A0ABR3Y0K7_9PEZI
MVFSRLLRQNNGSAVVFLGVGIVPLLIALGLILAAPHSALAAPCDPEESGYGPTSSPDTVSALHANPTYGAIASAAPIPTGYAVYDNNSNIPFAGYGTWSAAHSEYKEILRVVYHDRRGSWCLDGRGDFTSAPKVP